MAESLNDVLADVGLARKRVVLMRHAPSEAHQPVFRRNLIDLALSDPELFEFYQSFHTSTTAKRIGRNGYLVSALPGDGKQAIFYRIYTISGPIRSVAADRLAQEPPMQRLLERGLKPLSEDRYVIVGFERTPLLLELSGRLSFSWPWAAVNWCGEAAAKALNIPASIDAASVLRKNDR